MNDEDVAEVVVYWMVLIGIVLIVSLMGLGMAIIKAILMLFGIHTNL